MKKFLNISSLLLVALTMGFASCSHEEKDLFDDSAAHRLAQSKEYFYDILTSQGGKWQLEYFTTPDEPGYIYLFTFAQDGSVIISGENKYIGQITSYDNSDPVYGSARSMWEVITDDGPVLSFNTYNKYFHLFADPVDINDTDANEQGYGHSGDYEFDLMKYSNDTLYVEGKKYGVHMIMTRVPADVDDHQYLDEVVALKDSMFHAKIPNVFINLPSGYRYVVSGGASLLLAIYPETGDWISETEGYNAVVTHDGLTFMYPLQLMDSLTMTLYEVQTFKLAPDGSLVCRENPEISFTADALNGLITDPAVKWKVNVPKCSPAGFTEAYNALFDQLKAANRNNGINSVMMYYDSNLGKFVANISIKIRLGGKQTTMPCLFYFDVEREGKDLIKFTFNNEMDAAGARYIQTYNKLLDVVNYLASHQFKLSSSSLLAPVVLTVSEASNENNYIVLDVQRG
jgi:hypothetical protein